MTSAGTPAADVVVVVTDAYSPALPITSLAERLAGIDGGLEYTIAHAEMLCRKRSMPEEAFERRKHYFYRTRGTGMVLREAFLEWGR
jgi:hypothetical protein